MKKLVSVKLEGEWTLIDILDEPATEEYIDALRNRYDGFKIESEDTAGKPDKLSPVTYHV